MLLTTAPADPTACFFPWCSILGQLLAHSAARCTRSSARPAPPRSPARPLAAAVNKRSVRVHSDPTFPTEQGRKRNPPSQRHGRSPSHQPRPGQTPPRADASQSRPIPSSLRPRCFARPGSRSPPPMGTPQRPRPRPRQLARTNAMRNSSYSADAGADGDDDLAGYGGIQLSVDRAARGGGPGYGSQTSFRIRGGRGGAEEVAELFRQLGLSGPEDFAIRRPSTPPPCPTSPTPPNAAAPRSRNPPLRPGDGRSRASHRIGPIETIQVSAKAYQRPWAESKAILVESERVETSGSTTREATASSKPDNAVEEKGGGKLVKVETLRDGRTRDVLVEATRGATGGGTLPLVVAESTSCDIEHLISPSPIGGLGGPSRPGSRESISGADPSGQSTRHQRPPALCKLVLQLVRNLSSDGFFFAVKEVSLLDHGINAKQRIVQLEHVRGILLSRLEHDNIVQYYGTDKEDGKLYIFLELVTQGSLAALYQNIVYKIHKDIKCANILVDANGLVKLADFGLAKEMSILSQARSSKGTIFWMAPEVAKAKPHGPPADIWSLGCTVLEMLTAKFHTLIWNGHKLCSKLVGEYHQKFPVHYQKMQEIS
ncbi:hypothetical protein ZWY2020_022760 [Hordeum vulgare]|nr:hypothetical protein ZWY2020_022760 [Hordeum vulgare]